jgi:hypothetical protein
MAVAIHLATITLERLLTRGADHLCPVFPDSGSISLETDGKTMIRLRQHVPGWAEKTPWTAEADTLDEILNTPWVQLYRDSDGGPFFRWSLSPARAYLDGSMSQPLLMAEHNEGRHWSVVGLFIEHDASLPLSLPEWVPHPDGFVARPLTAPPRT